MTPPGPEAVPPPGVAIDGGRYEIVQKYDAATVAELRAAPAPAQPETSDGTTPAGDEHVLTAKGFVHIGNGFYPSGGAAARAWTMAQGQRVGADRVLIYATPASATGDVTNGFSAAFYVRFRLPFGASFRDLTHDEQQTVGVEGGVQIGSVVGGTPASEANLRAGDFVLKFDAKPVANRAAFQELLRQHMGKRVTLTINRDGALFDRLVRLGVLASEPGPQK